MQQNLDKLINNLAQYIKANYDFTGKIQSKIPNLYLFTSTQTSEFGAFVYEPSLCVILRGSKAVGFGDELQSYDSSRFLLAFAHVSANIKLTKASEQEPFLSLTLRFELSEIDEVLKSLENVKYSRQKLTRKGLVFGDMSVEILEALTRLITLSDKNERFLEHLSALIKKELLYTLLLNDEVGALLASFGASGSTNNKIARAIAEIKHNFNEKLNVAELAARLELSESSFYQNFKSITTLSPLQYQKQIRLQNARNLLSLGGTKVADIAFAVGYESPSQFNREYTRMFGISPSKTAI